MIIIDSTIKIPCPSLELLHYVKRACTITNPKYAQALKLNLQTYGIVDKLLYYKYNPAVDLLEAPIGLLPKLRELEKDQQFVDKRLVKSSVKTPKFSFSGKLRDYQQAVVDEMEKHEIGIIQAPTGSGKTVMMISHLAKHNRPTLILVNTIELANQFVDRLVDFTDLNKEDIGFYGNGKRKFKPITVCILQTLVKSDEDTMAFLNNHYVQVLSDEVHIVAANTYYEAMSGLNAKYKFGFSATPEREDGLTRVIHFAAGPKIHEVDIKNIKEKLAIPEYRRVNTDYYFPMFNANEYQNMLTDMAIDRDRNQLVLDLVEEYKGKQIVILCNRATQVIWLHKKIEGSEYLLSQIPELTDDFRPVYRNGKPAQKAMRKKAREGVIERLNSGETRVIISTVGLFSTGIDIASLEILILASPIKSKVKLKQSLGRIMRRTETEKAPVFVDLVDDRVELLRHQAYTRARIIKESINV